MGYSKLFGAVDLVYVPVKFSTMVGLGYAFVNWTTPEIAMQFMHTYGGFDSDMSPPFGVVFKATWSHCQGLENNVARYQNSAVMNSSVPASCKPVLLKDGCQILFPEPTKQLRKLRYRNLM
ncbi:unnamed protein product [Prorocentrum cordatum]|uniref:Mei2-like C-terminal RNA recognition motif domain-containing protein n=1 Tax=Prorocentrum cordatum TaxID=2364126 RepID=A0ABN9QNI5_9DINO|nr:unnamed protein product [Polarella glacialis]